MTTGTGESEVELEGLGTEAGFGTEDPLRGVVSDQLRERYRRYRARQGRDLLALLPREGLRALIRSTRAGEGERFELDFESPGALEALSRRCAALLPLPPFDLWILDFRRNRAAYLDAESGSLAPEGVSERPVTVDVREFQGEDGRVWVAALELEGADDRWSGAIRFHAPGEGVVYRTGSLLREADLFSVRERFLAFDRATLRALLRSALP